MTINALENKDYASLNLTGVQDEEQDNLYAKVLDLLAMYCITTLEIIHMHLIHDDVDKVCTQYCTSSNAQ